MKEGRLFQILYLLIERDGMTAAMLAEKLEVSVRTIYRDVDALSAAGIPIYAERGKGGGVRLTEGFVLDRSLFSTDEQDAILAALRGMQAVNAVECRQALARLGGLFRRETVDWVDVDFSAWGSDSVERAQFETLKQAILRRETVAFGYYSADGNRSDREVEPARLRFKGGNWYLQGFCLLRNEWRLFRLSRIENPHNTGRPFSLRGIPPSKLEPESCPQSELILRFTEQARFRIYSSFRREEVSHEPEGGFTVRTSYPDGNWVLGFLLSFGPDMRVVSPPWLGQVLAEQAKKICELYEMPLKPDTRCQVIGDKIGSKTGKKAFRMNYEVVTLPATTVAGPCTRTTNQHPERIGAAWQTLFSAQPDGGETYGVYTNYQDGVNGAYDAVAARKYCPGDPLPDGFQVIAIPAGNYAKFSFQGDPARDVGGFWQQVREEPLPRRFACDFERYVGEGPHGMIIEIYVGLADFCQSCGMPMQQESDYGTEADGSRSEDYCVYCYKDGKFLADCTMEQMIDFCLKIGEDAGRYPDRKQARQQMLSWFPTLKRWKAEG